MSACGALVATTVMLTEEAAEHARWPIDSKVVLDGGYISVETAKAALGVSGYGSNDFLDGFLAEVSEGRSGLDYLAYLQSACDVPLTSTILDSAFYGASSKIMQLIRFGHWIGFAEDKWAERDDVTQRIATRR